MHYSRFSMGNDVNDFNNDGQPDIVTVDMLPPDEKVLKTYGSDENPDIYKVKLELRMDTRNNIPGTACKEITVADKASAKWLCKAECLPTDWSWSAALRRL